MSLKALLEEKRAAILDRWIALALESYSGDSATFLRTQKDRFANPVGFALHKGLSGLLEGLLGSVEPGSERPLLDDILRIRAVQHLGPAASLAFLFGLKEIVRDELGGATSEPTAAAELRDLERRVDALGLVGFEVYTRCREQIYELRLTELRNRTMDIKEKLLRKRGQWTGPPEEELLLFPDGMPGEPAPPVTLDLEGPGGGKAQDPHGTK